MNYASNRYLNSKINNIIQAKCTIVYSAKTLENLFKRINYNDVIIRNGIDNMIKPRTNILPLIDIALLNNNHIYTNFLDPGCSSNCRACTLDTNNQPVCEVGRCDYRYAQNPSAKTCHGKCNLNGIMWY